MFPNRTLNSSRDKLGHSQSEYCIINQSIEFSEMSMSFREFYNDVIPNELAAARYMTQRGLLVEPEDVAPCHLCGGEMRRVPRRNRGNLMYIMRCRRRGCQTTRSIRDGNRFLHYNDRNNRINSNLKLWQILELSFCFVLEMKIDDVVQRTHHSRQTIVDWFCMCREVCSSAVLDNRNMMVGTADNPIQIDESRFAGKRKYNAGRMLAGDRAPEERDAEVLVENNRNHGNRVDGPWCFGLKQGDDHRYFYVERRNRATLNPIIEANCAPGSVIHSDEWAAYRNLSDIGYVHETVNHQLNYRDPDTGAHTQAIERSWLDAKTRIMKRMRGVPDYHLQGHLDHFCWSRLRRIEADLFVAFLNDMRQLYRN